MNNFINKYYSQTNFIKKEDILILRKLKKKEVNQILNNLRKNGLSR